MSFRILAAFLGLTLFAASCDSDDDGDGTATTTEETPAEPPAAAEGGTFIDGAQLVAVPSHIDPALVSELDGAQVTQLLYDGLTEFADSDDGLELRPLVAESWEANDDATVFTFTIKEGLQFSDGTPVLPTSFKRGWDRAADPELGGDYSYLFQLVEGFDEYQAGTATELTGVVADDQAMTFTVSLVSSYADFPAFVSFLIFMPVPEAVEQLTDQSQWERGIMIGNGPFKMEAPQNDQEIRLLRNDLWAGDVYGNTRAKLDGLIFRIFSDVDSMYSAFEAGETMSSTIPPGRFTESTTRYGNTADPQIASYHYVIGMRDADPLGGPENAKLRQAISLAIDREAINDAVYDGSRALPTSITPPGVPGFVEDLCDYCVTDQARAKELLQAFIAEGGTIPQGIRIRFNAGAGHEDVVAIVQQNLLEVLGIDAQQDPISSEVYFATLRQEGCPGICRAGWFYDYPLYDNGMYDLFHTESIGGNNLGWYSNPEFDRIVDEARGTVDDETRFELFREAERLLLNTDTGVIPINWYNGDQVYADGVEGYDQEGLGWVRFEQISLTG